MDIIPDTSLEKQQRSYEEHKSKIALHYFSEEEVLNVCMKYGPPKVNRRGPYYSVHSLQLLEISGAAQRRNLNTA